MLPALNVCNAQTASLPVDPLLFDTHGDGTFRETEAYIEAQQDPSATPTVRKEKYIEVQITNRDRRALFVPLSHAAAQLSQIEYFNFRLATVARSRT